MGLRITFRADAAGDIGFGHLRRCLTLAAAAAQRGHEITFLFSDFSDDTAAGMVNGVAQRIERVGGGGRPDAEITALESADVSHSDVLVSDCAHARVLAERLRLPALLRRLHERADRLVVIEGLGGESIAAECDGIADLLVTPYAVGAETQRRPDRTRQLVGAEFAILAPGYAAANKAARKIAPEARRLLITTGGADPTEVARRILSACERVGPAPLEIHVVVGPYFSPVLREALGAAATASVHDVSLIEAPDNLIDEMLWCDVAVSTSGLTKYELAATGTPTVMLSHDAAHAKNNEAFAALGAVRDLGEASGCREADLAEAIGGLLRDPAGRAEMSRHGRSAVDGAGAERIIDVIEEITA